MRGLTLLLGLALSGNVMLQTPVLGGLLALGCICGVLWRTWWAVERPLVQILRDHEAMNGTRTGGEAAAAWGDGAWPGPIEVPWRQRAWQTAETLSPAEKAQARTRACQVARASMGETLWASYVTHGYVEVPSGLRPGWWYRLRPGRRLVVRGGKRRALVGYLCVEPAYAMPAVEFLGHCVVLLRDAELEVLRVAWPRPLGGRIHRVF